MQKSGGKQTGGAPKEGVLPGNEMPDENREQKTIDSVADAANLDYARRQTELALEHLKHELDREKSDLLDRQGWTREEMQRFLDRWRQLSAAAKYPGAKGNEAKKQLDDALKSLGLRPGGTTIKHGATPTDTEGRLKDAGRYAPPADWAEQYREFSRGVAEEGKKK